MNGHRSLRHNAHSAFWGASLFLVSGLCGCAVETAGETGLDGWNRPIESERADEIASVQPVPLECDAPIGAEYVREIELSIPPDSIRCVGEWVSAPSGPLLHYRMSISGNQRALIEGIVEDAAEQLPALPDGERFHKLKNLRSTTPYASPIACGEAASQLVQVVKANSNAPVATVSGRFGLKVKNVTANFNGWDLMCRLETVLDAEVDFKLPETDASIRFQLTAVEHQLQGHQAGARDGTPMYDCRDLCPQTT